MISLAREGNNKGQADWKAITKAIGIALFIIGFIIGSMAVIRNNVLYFYFGGSLLLAGIVTLWVRTQI